MQGILFWMLGTRCAKMMVQNWCLGALVWKQNELRKHLPIPAAADGTTFAILAALRSSLDGIGGPLSTALLLAGRHWMGAPAGLSSPGRN